MKTKLIGNRKRRLEELMKEAIEDPKINEIIEGKESKPIKTKNDTEEVLIFSNRDIIQAIDKKGLLTVLVRPYLIKDFSMFKGRLYDCGNRSIKGTLDGKTLVDGVFDVICEYGNTLYGGGNGFVHSVFVSSSNKGGYQVTALYVHNNKLLYADSQGFVYDAFSSSKIGGCGKGPINALCSIGPILYYAYENKIHEIYANDAELKTRPSKVNAMCIHNGRLIDGGDYGIFDTITGNALYVNYNPKVDAMISIPADLFQDEFLSKIKEKADMESGGFRSGLGGP